MAERKIVELIERATLRAVESEMSNYKTPMEAVLELIDNAVDDLIPGQPLNISIRLGRREIHIYNEGGQGMDLEGLRDYLSWGHSDKADQQKIGRFGIGGKAAAGFLGNNIQIRASAQGSEEQYLFRDRNWATKDEVMERTHQVEVMPAHKVNEGYFDLTITDLRKGAISPTQLAETLGDVYKPLLENAGVGITINKVPVLPREISYLETDPEVAPVQDLILMNGFNEPIRVKKIGILEPGQRVKPGIRLYYRGRLVESEQFFGLPSPAQLPQASRFVGEIYLDSLAVTTAKTAFIRDLKWADSAQVIGRFIYPWEAKLQQLRLEYHHTIEPYEHRLASEAREIFENVIAKTPELLSAQMLPVTTSTRYPLEGSLSSGAPLSGSLFFNPDQDDRSKAATPTRPAQPKAPVEPSGQETGYRMRTRSIADWEITSMGVPETRVVLTTEGKRYSIRINSDFSMYQAAKRAHPQELERYILTTAVWQLGKLIHKDNLENFTQWYDRTLQLIGNYYQQLKVK